MAHHLMRLSPLADGAPPAFVRRVDVRQGVVVDPYEVVGGVDRGLAGRAWVRLVFEDDRACALHARFEAQPRAFQDWLDAQPPMVFHALDDGGLHVDGDGHRRVIVARLLKLLRSRGGRRIAFRDATVIRHWTDARVDRLAAELGAALAAQEGPTARVSLCSAPPWSSLVCVSAFHEPLFTVSSPSRAPQILTEREARAALARLSPPPPGVLPALRRLFLGDRP